MGWNGLWSAIFPGQGSQSVGMGRALLEADGLGAKRLRQADRIVGGGGKLLSLMVEGPAELLNQTEFTQPALFAVSAGLWDEAFQRGLCDPAYVAGHSLGEYSALYAAGVVDFETGLGLVVRRGQLMQAAGSKSDGAMAAIIGLEDEVVERVVGEVGSGVVVANYNSPGQVVISGPRAGVEQAGAALKAAGAKRVLPLPVSGAFHSPAVSPANDELIPEIQGAQFSDPRVPVIMNVDGQAATTAAEVRERLTRQMIRSVRWTPTVQYLARCGVKTTVELGSGKVLSGLVKRITPDLEALSAATLEELEAVIGQRG